MQEFQLRLCTLAAGFPGSDPDGREFAQGSCRGVSECCADARARGFFPRDTPGPWRLISGPGPFWVNNEVRSPSCSPFSCLIVQQMDRCRTAYGNGVEFLSFFLRDIP